MYLCLTGQPKSDRDIGAFKRASERVRSDMDRLALEPVLLPEQRIPPEIVSAYPQIVDDLPHIIVTYRPASNQCYHIPVQKPVPKVILYVSAEHEKPAGKLSAVGSVTQNGSAHCLKGFKPSHLIRGKIMFSRNSKSFFTVKHRIKETEEDVPRVQNWLEVTMVVG